MATRKKAAVVATPKAPTIQVLAQPEKPYRAGSARDLYWIRVQAHDGKTLADLQASVDKEPPSQPKRGKLAQKTEPLSGWVSWFTQQGLMKISAQ